MKRTLSLLVAVVSVSTLALGCAGPAASGGSGAASFDASASQANAAGLQITRPDGWRFVPVDKTVTKDTVSVIQSPLDGRTLAAAIEVSHRKLTAQDQRRPADHVLTQIVTELVQLMAGFEMNGEPQKISLAGKDGAKIELKFTEMLTDGTEVERSAAFYGVVSGDSIWVIRCIGKADGSDAATFDSFVSSLSLSDGNA